MLILKRILCRLLSEYFLIEFDLIFSIAILPYTAYVEIQTPFFYILTIWRFIGKHTERNLSVETAITIKMVPLNAMPLKGCQINGYVRLYHSGVLIKCCTIDFCQTISIISMVSAMVRLKWIKLFNIYTL